ncbi:MAG: UDP-3-O-acyl-N-acetylglucosamine deacetylase [Desulfobulbus sp.]|nr:MAG: UDP-3-O-acyl-N-acetylglucosamine deacetylase [Desulfobulbus sp.]
MSSHIEPHQYTLRRSVSCCGIGLHTGRPVTMTLKPASANSGISFFRSDLHADKAVPAHINKVVDTTLATTIGEGESKISTTEHLLAALRASGIDNVHIDIDAHEVPIMDGSAGPFVHLLQRGGRKRQRALRKILRIIRPISVTDGEKSIRIEPYNGFKVTGRICFGDNVINEQSYSVDVTPERFSKEIARARTFGFVEQVEQLWRNGLALGGNLNNVIAIHWDGRSILNEEGLRFDDEFVRHKVLDLIGDMALLGSPVLGHVIADRSGHSLHLDLMQSIVDNPQCWEYVKFQKKGKVIQRRTIAGSRTRPKQLPLFFPPNLQGGVRPSACPA